MTISVAHHAMLRRMSRGFSNINAALRCGKSAPIATNVTRAEEGDDIRLKRITRP